jgi:hypothetical protein
METKEAREYLPSNAASKNKLAPLAHAFSRSPRFQQILYRIFTTVTKPLLSLLLPSNTYNMLGLITDKNCDFMKNPQFLKGYAAAMRQQYKPSLGGWQVHVNQWAAFHAKQLEGDFVECGVNRGMYSMSNITYIDFKSLKERKYYLFDTFCGLDQEFCTEEEYLVWKDQYPDCYEFVVDSFKEYPNVVIVKGPVPKTLSQVDIKKVAYLHIDMNCALPEAEALKYFWPKLERGGIVVLDDYGWPACINQKRAIDDFVSSVGVKVLSLPTGQGMIIKPH